MKRKPLLLGLLFGFCIAFQSPANLSAGALPNKIPSAWTDRLVDIISENMSVCGVLVAPTVVMTCAHWSLEEANGTVAPLFCVFRRDLAEVERIAVTGFNLIENEDVSFLTLERAPRNVYISKLAAAEPENGAFVAALGSPFRYSKVWTVGVYNGHRHPGISPFLGEVALVAVWVFPGNSGGPVVDGDGRLVGIVSGGYNGAGLSLVVPLTTLKRALDNAGIAH